MSGRRLVYKFGPSARGWTVEGIASSSDTAYPSVNFYDCEENDEEDMDEDDEEEAEGEELSFASHSFPVHHSTSLHQSISFDPNNRYNGSEHL